MSEKRIHIFTTCIVLLMSCMSYAQRLDVDFGLLLGSAQYNGDVNMTRAYTHPSPTIGFIFRKNFSPFYSIRAGLTFGRLRCEDSYYDNSYQQNRDFYFDDTRLMELSAMLELNFFEVTTNKKDHNFSPYTVFGLGLMYYENTKWYEHINIPMGLGIKYKILPRLEIRGEWVFRKTFTDKLDQLADNATDGFLEYKQINFKQTNDWFSILGISLLFNFSDDKVPCPIYEPKKYMTRRRR